jgi:aromatic ring-opening dioxygenase LigB subunit
MPLVFACVAPHGEPIIPALSRRSERRKYAITTRSMERLAREIRALRPDTLVVATPHNLRLRGYIGVVTSEFASGVLPMFQPGPVKSRIRVVCDRALADVLLDRAAKRHLPAVGANYATASGKYSNMPLDWGSLVPLWFFLRGYRRAPQVLIVTPSREIPLEQNVRFGELLAEVARRSRKRLVFVASADHAHAHDKSGPYGYHPAAAEYDAVMARAIRQDDLAAVLRLDPAVVEAAKPDSLWQIAMLHGVARRSGLRAEFLSYDVPAYYGMICAAFRPPARSVSAKNYRRKGRGPRKS